MNIASILVVIIIVIILYYLIKQLLKTKILSPMAVATAQQSISADKLNKTTDGNTINCTYSIWFYVNDWASSYGEKKVIFQRGNSLSNPDLQVYLGPLDNKLYVASKVTTNPGYDNKSNQFCNLPDNKVGLFTEDVRRIPIDPTYPFASNSNIYIYDCEQTCDNTANCVGANFNIGGENNNAEGALCKLILSGNGTTITQDDLTPNSAWDVLIKENSGNKVCFISDVPIQRWVNVIISSTTTSIDIYLDGIMIQSCSLPGELNVANNGSVYITPEGYGFNGWTSKLQYWNKYINPQQAYNIYKAGSGAASFTSNYKLNIVVTKGGEEKKNITF